MLIWLRRIGETICIGDDVTVVVHGVKGGQVRLGIGAPRNVTVHREEIYHRMKQEELIEAKKVGPFGSASTDAVA
jgi:carbon storage regulator